MAHSRTEEARQLVYADCPVDDPGQFRLLVLRPGPRDAQADGTKTPVIADLRSFQICEAPPYIALSYSWGTEPTGIELEIGPLACIPITKHLDRALRQARNPRKSVFLWVDALCIDQQNVEERSAQVSIMQHIFSAAEDVYIWLGMGTDVLSARNLEDGPTAENLRWMIALNRDTKQNDQFVGLNAQAMRSIMGQQTHAWWKRKWVLQEVSVAKNPPLVLYDEYIFDGAAFFKSWPAEFILGSPRTQQISDVRPGQTWSSGIWQAFMSMEQSMRVPWLMRDWWTYYQIHPSEGRPLGELLRIAAASNTSNHLDHVYALLGLTTAQHRAEISVDYSKPPERLFRDVSRLLWDRNTNAEQHSLVKDGESTSFAMLAFQWSRYETPSWSCNFSVATGIDRVDYQTWTHLPTGNRTEESSEALTFVQKRWNYHNIETEYAIPELPTSREHDNLITLYGVVLDTVEFALDAAKYMNHPHAWQVMAEALHCKEDHLRAIKVGVAKYDKGMPEVRMLEPFRIFTTQNGNLGLAYRSSRPSEHTKLFNIEVGDDVALMLGATTPVTA
ncbi:hypothetical protein CLAFUW4_10093 [Fulvia fulva]|uniref:Heterokaryon incompatibility domain-containing protein n=1 Tax=Passalora fulva TaxID=5499 RepID=A0A9Q8LEW9_PASFU|nr:uncharacterized protein CLAFUR5_04706 [Fulvia fulva]KAK4615827.1 hypothetical protein CLAFUR4_10097 [Fulvia fulva]KAK4616459.1 hypothetical protein CLAFUR0_10095 [Fulvia fulva]UJO16177.1 hypothetical protein CLAFUR5_04706 [Fulvia fulva]WPV19273.1 hypothetical protein CLAFUW4_10093 [Fulvia fulva]WPV33903.1 hypothetical protein CLAFUW7_10094 [Fulvia fulva]